MTLNVFSTVESDPPTPERAPYSMLAPPPKAQLSREMIDKLHVKDLAAHLVTGDTTPDWELESPDSARVHSLYEVLSHPSADAGFLQQRQRFIQEISPLNERATKDMEQFWESFERLNQALCFENSHFFPWCRFEDFDRITLTFSFLQYCSEGAVQTDIQNVHDVIVPLSGTSDFFRELLSSLDRAQQTFTAFAENAEFKKLKDDLAKVVPYGNWRTLRDKTPKKLKLHYQKEDAISALYERLYVLMEPFGTISRTFNQFCLHLDIAKYTKERGMHPIQIDDSNGATFQNARNPFVIADKGAEATVPFDLHITADHPLLVVTGAHGQGKSTLINGALLNALLAQTITSGFCNNSSIGIRNGIQYIEALGSNAMTDTKKSRGQKEIAALAEIVKTIPPKSIVAMDEALTATDHIKSLCLILAILDNLAKQGTIVLVTLHSGLLHIVEALNLAPNVQFIRSKQSDISFQWENGIGESDTFEAAEDLGIDAAIVEEAVRNHQKMKRVLDEALVQIQKNEPMHPVDMERVEVAI